MWVACQTFSIQPMGCSHLVSLSEHRFLRHKFKQPSEFICNLKHCWSKQQQFCCFNPHIVVRVHHIIANWLQWWATVPSGSLLKVTSQLIFEWISLMLSPGFVLGLVHIWRKDFCFSWSQHFFSMACQIVGAQHFRCNSVILNVELYWFMASEQFHQCFFKDSFGDMLW